MAPRRAAAAPAAEPPRGARAQPSLVRNKQRREELTRALRRTKAADKKARVKRRRADDDRALTLGHAAAPKKVPRTIENTREKDETVAALDDDELHADDAQDEFSGHFSRQYSPKVLITTSQHPSKITYQLIKELLTVVPDAAFYRRAAFTIRQITKYATAREFSSVLVLNDNHKRPNAVLLVNLPDGPTLHFKLSNLVLRKKIKLHGRPTSHKPELILNNFTTRLGHRVGRCLASLFPQDPQFRGRRVVTFHNQRDFIFFRHHRYIFETKQKKVDVPEKKVGSKSLSRANREQVIARLQECGPRFTLKLISIQHGTFSSKSGEYEWIHKADMDTSRRRFFL
eukprot:SM000080S22982  [mRNA]  locus=s80:511562:514167:+ [translate_table: standard]